MNELEFSIIILKRNGYKIEPHGGEFDVVREGSRLQLTKEEMIECAKRIGPKREKS